MRTFSVMLQVPCRASSVSSCSFFRSGLTNGAGAAKTVRPVTAVTAKAMRRLRIGTPPFGPAHAGLTIAIDSSHSVLSVYALHEVLYSDVGRADSLILRFRRKEFGRG